MATGSCLCGTVQFSFDDDITDLSHCHCSMCRKVHGTPFATYVNVKNLRIEQGESSVKSFQSSPGFTRTFCGACGSVLPEMNSADGSGFLPAGIVNEDIPSLPQEHIFVESKASWFEISDQLPQKTAYGEDSDLAVIDTPAPPATEAGYVGGSCVCGDVAFRFKDNAKFMMYCHCSRCRKVKGAAHAANVFVDPSDFEWIRGEHNTTIYDLPDAQRFGNSFCNNCGSSLPRKATASPLINVPAGALDDAPGVESKGHIFIGSKANWYDIKDDLPQYEEMPDS